MESESSDDEINLAEAVLAANATAKRKRESLDVIDELKTIRNRIDWIILQFEASFIGKEFDARASVDWSLHQSDFHTAKIHFYDVMQYHLDLCENQRELLLELKESLAAIMLEHELHDYEEEWHETDLRTRSSMQSLMESTEDKLSKLFDISDEFLHQAKTGGSGRKRLTIKHVYGKGRRHKTDAKLLPSIDEMTAEEEQDLIADLSKPDNWDKAQKEIARTLHIFRDYCEGELSQRLKSSETRLTFMSRVMRHKNAEISRLNNEVFVKGGKINALTSQLKKLRTTASNQTREIEELRAREIPIIDPDPDGGFGEAAISLNQHRELVAELQNEIDLKGRECQELEVKLAETEEKSNKIEGVVATLKAQVASKEEKVCEAKLLIEKLKKEGEMPAVKASVDESAIQAPQNSPEPSLHETISPTPPTKTVEIALAEVSRLRNQVTGLEKENMLLREELSCKQDELKRMKTLFSELLDKEPDISQISKKTVTFSPKQRVKTPARDTESTRVQNFLEKEKQRYDASVRKLQQDYSQSFANIHKEAVLVLRAINRFREGTISLLHREALFDAAHELKKLESLQLDDSKSGQKSILSDMGSSAVELLVDIEYILSQALLNQRLALKETTFDKTLIGRELEAKVEEIKKARQVAFLHMEKLREVRRQLHSQKKNVSEDRVMEKERLRFLTKRHRDLEVRHGILMKDILAKQRDYMDLLEANQKTKTVTRSENGKSTPSELQEEKPTYERTPSKSPQPSYRKGEGNAVYINLSAQHRNLRVLNKAVTSRRIMPDLRKKAADAIEKCLSIPQRRFAHLVKRYYAHCKVKAAEAAKEKWRQKFKGSRRVQNYLDALEQRIFENREHWRRRRDSLVLARKRALEQVAAVFSEVKGESGVVLVTPLGQAQKRETNSRSETEKKETRYKSQILTKNTRTRTEPLRDISLIQTGQPLWSRPVTRKVYCPPISMPRLLVMEMTRNTLPPVSVPAHTYREGESQKLAQQHRIPSVASGYPPRDNSN